MDGWSFTSYQYAARAEGGIGMAVPKILIKKPLDIIKKLIKNYNITPRSFADELGDFSKKNLKGPGYSGLNEFEKGVLQATRREKMGYPETVKWHGTPSTSKAASNFEEGVFHKDSLGLHVGTSKAAMDRGAALASELIKDKKAKSVGQKLGEHLNRRIRKLGSPYFSDKHGWPGEELKILKNLEKQINESMPLSRGTLSASSPFDYDKSHGKALPWLDLLKGLTRKTTTPIKSQAADWHLIPFHTKVGKQLRMPDVGLGAGGGWESAHDIVKAMRQTARYGRPLNSDRVQLEIGKRASGLERRLQGKAYRNVQGVTNEDRAVIKRLLANYEDEFAKIDGSGILPKFDNEGKLIRYPGGDRVQLFANMPMYPKSGMALLKKILKKEGYDSIVYKNLFEDRGEDSWILLNAAMQAKSPNAAFLKRKGTLSGLLPLMDVLRGQREE